MAVPLTEWLGNAARFIVANKVSSSIWRWTARSCRSCGGKAGKPAGLAVDGALRTATFQAEPELAVNPERRGHLAEPW